MRSLVTDFLNKLILLHKERMRARELIPLTKIAEIMAKVCASAGAVGIGLKLYASFSMAFFTNSVVFLPINPNIWDATFLIISGLALTFLQLRDTLQWNIKMMAKRRQ